MLKELKISANFSWYGLLALSAASAYGATPSSQGQSGYINMPSAFVEADGTITAGYSYDSPYGSFWTTITPLPFLQVTGRYVSITGIPGFSRVEGQYGSAYGRYKDKVADLKLRLSEESAWLPSISVGSTDVLGTELFKGSYLVASKVFGHEKNIEASLGYGRKRPEGLFAGVRWVPQPMSPWAVVAEYDANNYAKDFRAAETFAKERGKGASVGLEYRWGWLGAQVAWHRDHYSANAFVSIPFSEREFVPKVYEPAPFDPKNAPIRVSPSEWGKPGGSGSLLIESLIAQDFKNVRVQFEDGTLKLSLTNSRISNMGRAVGRAVRTALAFAPEGTRAIQVSYTKQEQPIATYEFVDLRRLSDYLTGLLGRDAFLDTVVVRYAQPADRAAADEDGLLASVKDTRDGLSMQVGHEGSIVQLASEDREANRFKLTPKMSFFFNDPSGALRYELWAAANYDRKIGQGLYLNSDLKLDLFENVSAVKQPSNSLLPHVRSDVAEYKRGSRFKLNRLLVNQYSMPMERVYTRVSGGLYEEMFRGFGGQVLYLPKASHWAVDFTADALQQRGFRGWFDKRDYKTVSALAAFHYRLPYDITATARAGRFLAKDEGVRFEFKRRFASGVEIGVWYTRTNGRDITNPGTPLNPYNDKGIFLSVPLSIMLPADSQASAGVALSPWTRDVGQMVASPGDLYDLVEQPRRDLTSYDGLGNFSERRDEQNLPAVNPPAYSMPSPWPAFRWRLEQSVSKTPTLPQSAKLALLGGAGIAAAALLDKPVDRFMKKHEDASVLRAWSNVGKDLPILLTGAAAGAVAIGDSRMQNMGMIALQSVAGALVLSVPTKHLIGRARPRDELGAWGRATDRSNASFPSNHAAIAFAAVTPFAQEYDAPWLYGLAAAGSLGRTANRQHWTSDVVAGGVFGFAVGSWLWQAQRDNTRSSFAINPAPKSISLAWSGQY